MAPVPGPREGLNAAVAAQLRAEAAAAQLSDKALAEKAGVNYASLRRWLGKETGNERHIDVAVLATIADALGIEPGEIIRRAEARLIDEQEAADKPDVAANLPTLADQRAKNRGRAPQPVNKAARKKPGKPRIGD